jgi:hypothetical protein
MALGLNKIILANATANTPGAYLQITTVSAANAGTVIPAGTYLVFPAANATINAVSAYNATSNVATWSVLMAANTGGVLISDGVNVSANSTVAGATTVTLLTVDGGQAVSGTYNAS